MKVNDDQYVIECRKALGLTQRELANAIGWTTPVNVCSIENGRRTLSLQTRLAIECLMRRSKKI